MQCWCAALCVCGGGVHESGMEGWNDWKGGLEDTVLQCNLAKWRGLDAMASHKTHNQVQKL